MASQDREPGRYELRDPDVRLMLQVRDDDAAAFEELMLRYQHRVLRVLEHLAPNRSEAEDLTQEVFLRVFRARKSYTPDSKFSTWLFTIVHRVASNARRNQARRRESQLPATPSGQVAHGGMEQLVQATTGSMPSRVMAKVEMREIVRAALTHLNPRQRMAVLLNKFEGMSYADIAETMGVSVSAVKSLLSRARVALKDVLEPYLAQGRRPRSENGSGPWSPL